MRSKIRFGLVAVGAATLLTAALGCGSSDTPDSPGSATSVAPKANADPADAGLSPVKVGFHNLEGGAISLPDLRLGFEAGLEYVNAELGGINGHPLEAVYCNTDGTPDSSLNCGNTFVQDGVVLAVQGIDFGGDGILPALKSADIAEFGAIALTPGLNAAVNDAAFGLTSTQESYAADLVQEKALGNTKIAVVFPDVPASRSSYDSVVAPVATKLGLEVDPYYYAPGTDWTTQAATILAQDPEAVSLWAADADALAAVQALRGAGFTGTINASSTTTIIDVLDSATLENVLFMTPYYNPDFVTIPDKPAADVAVFDTYTDGKGITKTSQALQGFYVAVQSADILRQTPGDPITAEAVSKTIQTAKGDQFFSTSQYDCSTRTWPGTSACGTGMIFSKVNSDKKLEVLDNQPVDVSGVRPAN